MELLKQRILEEGRVEGTEILKVDSFLNHQIDVALFNEMGKTFYDLYKDAGITKILTIEASGIGIACIVAQYFQVPVVFAKKTESRNLDKETYESEVYSFTKQKSYTIRVSKRYLTSNDTVLILDDFLAKGKAALGLKSIVEQAGAKLSGVGVVIEKSFQEGGQTLRDQGIRVDALASIGEMHHGKVVFA